MRCDNLTEFTHANSGNINGMAGNILHIYGGAVSKVEKSYSWQVIITSSIF